MNIYVGNLNYEVTDHDLLEAFSEFGTVDKTSVIIDKFSGRSKGFGFVEMTNKEEGQKAIDALNNTQMQGRTIKVNEAQPRAERPAFTKRY